MENRVFFKINIKDIPYKAMREGVFVLKLTSGNIHKWPNLLRECIVSFNSDIQWDGMWTVEQGMSRLKNEELLFVLLSKKSQKVISFVWFNLWEDQGYLYNAFSHSSKEKGDTYNFISYCLNNLNYNTKQVILYCDQWNVKAQSFFKKFVNPI